MKAIILAGGRGTRIQEESIYRPKPMIEIGGMPILWHIMKIYSNYGINDFIICLGYKGYMIKDFFANYLLHKTNATIKLRENKIIYDRKSEVEDWTVTLLETGDCAETGGRIKQALSFLDTDDETVCLTYGDGVADVNIKQLIDFHFTKKVLATVTGVQPAGRFGALEITDDKVAQFLEKPKGDGGYINGGFFVISRNIKNYLPTDKTIWENEPLQQLASQGQLAAYKHHGFWHPMDTLRDKKYLEQLWSTSSAPWKIW